MRLLNVSTREVEEFHGTEIPPYAILSHTLGAEEVTLYEMEGIARYRRSQQEPPHMVSRSATSPDAMKLMLLSNMLMAFRGDKSRFSRPSPFPALTNGHQIDDDGRSLGRVVPSASPHPFELKAGYSKIAYACGQAEKDGYRYVWVDTCCIDRKSSAEVSEAVNAMFGWYQRAAVCYAYLEDVHFDDYTEGYRTWRDDFNSSRWFTRGWTLQELLAPRRVIFYAKGWRLLGTKSSLVKNIEKITGIDELTLLEPKLIHNASVAQRMSWAAHRTTTKPEDVAYSLLGLFKVHMPIIYGEGENAFLRLQEEIIKRSDDHSLFAWGTLGNDLHNPHLPHHNTPPNPDDFDYDTLTDTTSLLAKSPLDFAGMNHILTSPPPPSLPTTDYTLTNKGLHIHLTLTASPSPTTPTTHLALLNCHPSHSPTSRLALPLTATPTPNLFLRTRAHPTLIPLPTSHPQTYPGKPKTIYIPTHPSHLPPPNPRLSNETILVRAPDLVAPGYDVLDIRCAGAADGGPGGGGAQWNRELGSIRLGGVDYSHSRSGRGGGGVLWQVAVVVFWNRVLGCGFVVRVLVEGVSRVVFVDLLLPPPPPAPGLGGLEGGGEEKRLLEQARAVWERPGVVEVTVPAGSVGKGGGEGRRVVRVEVVNPVGGEGVGEGGKVEQGTGGSGWTLGLGHEVKVCGSVTFTEKWEREYQRTVNARVERKKKGVIELSMSSMLWQAAPAVQHEELDQPS